MQGGFQVRKEAERSSHRGAGFLAVALVLEGLGRAHQEAPAHLVLLLPPEAIWGDLARGSPSHPPTSSDLAVRSG